MNKYKCKYCGRTYQSTEQTPSACPECQARMEEAAQDIETDAAAADPQDSSPKIEPGQDPEWNGVHFTDGVQMPTREEMRAFWQHQRELDDWAHSLTTEQINRLCDMGYYNDAMKGYCLRAAREMGLTEDQSRELLRCFGYALDVMDKEEAENLYTCTNG